MQFREINRYSKTTVREWLESLEEPEPREKYLRFYDNYCVKFEHAPAGARHHHWWVGGLAQHTAEVIALAGDWMCTCARDMAELGARAESIPTLGDVIVAGFLHDFPKIWTYRPMHLDEWKKKGCDEQIFTYTNDAVRVIPPEDKLLLALSRAGIVPTERQWGAVLFHEGGWSERHFGWQGETVTSETAYSANPLAVLIHEADLYSGMVLGRGLTAETQRSQRGKHDGK